MTKRLVDIDDDLLEDARGILGTKTLKDTVNTSLRRTAETGRRNALTAADLQCVAALLTDLGDPDVMAKAWE